MKGLKKAGASTPGTARAAVVERTVVTVRRAASVDDADDGTDGEVASTSLPPSSPTTPRRTKNAAAFTDGMLRLAFLLFLDVIAYGVSIPVLPNLIFKVVKASHSPNAVLPRGEPFRLDSSDPTFGEALYRRGVASF